VTTTFAALLQAFFAERLVRERRVSHHTVAAYRDCFRLLFGFAKQRLSKVPSLLLLEDLDAPFVVDFLQYLETERDNGARSRNARLAALHSFFSYVALREPAYAHQCQRVLAIPSKRHEKRPIDFLLADEIEALLGIIDRSTWIGRRDRTLLSLAIQTGLRVSELVTLRCRDIVLGPSPYVRCEGKGRKQRCTPLRRDLVALVEAWLRERRGQPGDPAFPSQRGGPLSRDALEKLLARYATAAAAKCPSLRSKRVSPHVLRHTAAMELLRHGVDRTVIALWLGHESVETTHVYLHADLNLKEQALAKTSAFGLKPGRFRADDDLVAFLEAL
jgi:site-specific recombinase XerD